MASPLAFFGSTLLNIPHTPSNHSLKQQLDKIFGAILHKAQLAKDSLCKWQLSSSVFRCPFSQQGGDSSASTWLKLALSGCRTAVLGGEPSHQVAVLLLARW